MFAAAFRAALALALMASVGSVAAPARAQLGTKPKATQTVPQKRLPLKPLGAVRPQAKPKRSTVVGSGPTRHELSVH
jgi:hypothetical protein